MSNPKKQNKSAKNEWKESFKEFFSGIAYYAAGVGIIVGVTLVFFGIVWAISLLFNSSKTDGPPTEYIKSAEQKKYEQECIKVNVAIQEEPDTEFKIKSDSVVAYCGCLGEQLFPNGSEKIIYPEESGPTSKTNIRHTCENSVFREDDYYNNNVELSNKYGDKKYIQEKFKDTLRNAIGFFYRDYGYSISINESCVLDAVYDDKNPPYYFESLWLDNKIQPAIRACSTDPNIDKLLNDWFD